MEIRTTVDSKVEIFRMVFIKKATRVRWDVEKRGASCVGDNNTDTAETSVNGPQ